MKTFATGQRVRLSVDGVIRFASNSQQDADVTITHDGNVLMLGGFDYDRIEAVVEPPRVGDMVTGVNVDHLPLWTVVLDQVNAYQLQSDGMWYQAADGGRVSSDLLARSGTATVLHLP